MNQAKKTPSTIDKYIEAFPEDIQKKMQELRKVIKEVAPEAEETISYGIPTFKTHGTYLVYFSGNKKHIGFYPFPSGIEMFKKEASGFKTSKGTVQFPYDKPIPWDLVRKVVEFRMRENHLKMQS